MPTLQANLTVKLDVGSLVGGLGGTLAGPAGRLTAIASPASEQEIGATAELAGSVEIGGIGNVAGQVAAAAGGALQGLPGAQEVIRPVTDALALVQTVSAGDLEAQLRGLGERLSTEFDPESHGGTLGALLNVGQVLSSAPEGRVLLELLTSFLGRAGVDVSPSALTGGDVMPALAGGLQVIAGMMCIESVLAEAERLTGIMAAQLDPGSIRPELSAVRACLSENGLAAFVSTVDVGDAAQVDAAAAAIVACGARLDALRSKLSAALGFGEATLVHMDVDRVQAEVRAGLDLVRTGDLEPLGRLVARLLERLQPVFALDVSGEVAGGLDGVLRGIEEQVETLAAAIRAFDTSALSDPLAQGLGAVSGVASTVTSAIDGASGAVRGALAQVTAAIRALPLDEMADAIRAVMDRVGQALDAVRALVHTIQTALEAAGGEVTGALEEVEGVLDTFQHDVDAFFAEARTFVESLDLDALLGGVTQAVTALSEAVAGNQLHAVFDTTVDAIGGAADVVGNIPFGLIPDSMKGELDAAVRPIKEADAAAARDQVLELLAIRDGHFEMTADLTVAVEEVQAQIDAVLAAVRGLDPRGHLRQLDESLHALAEKIRTLAPDLALEPVQAAVDSVREALAGFDLEAQLAPVQAAFDQVLAAIDEYSPVRLITPVEEALDEARGKLVELVRLAEWEPTLDGMVEQAKGLLDRFDPALLEPRIRAALDEATALLDLLPDLPLGTGLGSLVAALFSGSGRIIYGSSFGPVMAWLGGGASGTAELNARALRVSDNVQRTQGAVAELELDAAAADTAAGHRALLAAIAALPAGAGRDRLRAAAEAIAAEEVMAALVAGRARYQQRLATSAAAAETLRRTGFSEIDVGAGRFRAAATPFGTLGGFLRGILARLGITGVEDGLPGIARSLLAVVTPERLAGIVVPIYAAFRERIEGLIDAVANPVRDAIHQITQLVNAVDLTPLREAVQEAVDAAKEEVSAFSPAVLLATPIASFKALQEELAGFNPVGEIVALLEAIRDAAARVLDKLSAERLLASALAIYDHVLAELEKLDVADLVVDLLAALDAVAAGVEDGLERTVEAFQRLQAALPGGGGGSSVSVSASVSLAA
ncbi:MAG TPA: hypothetical protein VF092_13330 [Longimicrobium sp.]